MNKTRTEAFGGVQPGRPAAVPGRAARDGDGLIEDEFYPDW